jgi:hypothetical protein
MGSSRFSPPLLEDYKENAATDVVSGGPPRESIRFTVIRFSTRNPMANQAKIRLFQLRGGDIMCGIDLGGAHEQRPFCGSDPVRCF